MLPWEVGWTHAQRRKTPANNNVINFYVTNIPTGVTKAEFKEIFSPFGKLIDIYFGEKKGKKGKNFGFIKFVDVPNVRGLEQQLNGTRCRNNMLEINVEKHKIKVAQPNPIPVRKPLPTFYNNASYPARNTRDERSFDEVVKHKAGPITPLQAPTPPIQLIEEESRKRWMGKKVLTGETKSLLHLCHMLALLSNHYDKWVEVKYTGGLGILLRFDGPESVCEFLMNEAVWKEMFRCRSIGEPTNTRFERIAWIKIAGLPIRNWSEPNLEKITAKYGKKYCPI
ncbi:unnamed protein product [Lactuca virosa]|uniref:RRM domain-containing protein n=1 Tax=Lactuca virosa TaxID=75947 RepID=A0AAU9NQ42_9ASTR|nr:unnamed protein product [Lactuca virosa]